MHGLAALSLFLPPLAGHWQALLLLAVLFSLHRTLRSSAFRSLRLAADGAWLRRVAGEQEFRIEVLADSTVFVWLVVLRFRLEGEGRVRALTLLPDHLSREEFRMLRIWLRWHSAASARGASIS